MKRKSRRSPRARLVNHTIEKAPNIPTPSVSSEPTDEELLALITSEGSLQKLEEEARILSEAVRQERAELGHKSFWHFLTQILFPTVWEKHYTEDFHKPLCDTLQNLGQGENFWAFLARGSRKSYILTIAFSIWCIIRDPNIRILLIGAREETVKPFTQVILSAFMPDTPGFEILRQTYPDFVITEKGRNVIQAFKFTHPKRTAVLPDPTFRSSYVNDSGAGRRADIIIFDDCVEARNVTNPTQSAKTLKGMLEMLPLLDKGSEYKNIIGVGTRWSHFDPYSKILGERSEEELKDFESKIPDNTRVMVRHAMEEPGTLCDVCPPHVVKHFPHGRPSMSDTAEAVMSPIVTREDLFRELQAYMTDPARGESMFWHQYMNVCLAPGDQKIKSEWLIRAHFPTWPVAKRRVLVLDDASKDFQLDGVGDYSVAVFGEFDETGRLLIVDGIRSNRWTKDKFIREIIVWCKRHGWWPHFAVKEKATVDAFLSDLRRAFDEQARPLHIKTAALGPTSGKKYDRIVSALQGPLERAELVFGSSCSLEFFTRAKYELTNLTQVANDDVADGLSLFYTEGVRIVAPAGHNNANNFEWQAPDMSSLNVFERQNKTPPPAPSRGPWETAAASDRVRSAMADLDLEEGYDPFSPPPGAMVFEYPTPTWDDIE